MTNKCMNGICKYPTPIISSSDTLNKTVFNTNKNNPLFHGLLNHVALDSFFTRNESERIRFKNIFLFKNKISTTTNPNSKKIDIPNSPHRCIFTLLSYYFYSDK